MKIPSPLLVLLLLGFSLGCAEAPIEDAPQIDVGARIWLGPNSGSSGVPRTVLLRGLGTHWREGEVTVDFGAGVSVAVLLVEGEAALRALLEISAAAPIGPRDVTLRWGADGSSNRILRDAFFVESASITSAPDFASLGETVQLTVTGFGTSFTTGLTALSLGPGIEISDVEVVTTSRLTATVHVRRDASPGARDLVVYNGGGDLWTYSGALRVDRTTRGMMIAPDHADQRQLLEVRIQADGAQLVVDATELDMGTGILVEDLQVLAPDSLVARLRIGNNARVGWRDVEVFTFPAEGGMRSHLLPEGFRVDPVLADPLRARASLSFGISRSHDSASCAFRTTVYASAQFYEPNDFPCPSSGASSNFAPPGLFDIVSTGYVNPASGSTDCPSSKTFDAGPYVELVASFGDPQAVRLERIYNPFSGRIYYRGGDLEVIDYQEAMIYDLVTPGGDLGGSELPPWNIEDALYTLPKDYQQHGPDYCDLEQPLSQPMSVRWEPAQTYDEASFYLYVLGTGGSEGVPVMMIYPWDDGAYDLRPSDLQFFPEGWAMLLQNAYRNNRFEVPGSEYVNAGSANSAIMWRGSFQFVGE